MEKERNNADQHEQENAKSPRNASSEAAGIVRGLSRSLGKSIANNTRSVLQNIPRVLKQWLTTQRGRLRVRRVANVSDRISTGWDVYSTAMESKPSDKKDRSWRPMLKSLQMFATSEF